MSQQSASGGTARLSSMRSNASSSGRTVKRTSSKPVVGPFGIPMTPQVLKGSAPSPVRSTRPSTTRSLPQTCSRNQPPDLPRPRSDESDIPQQYATRSSQQQFSPEMQQSARTQAPHDSPLPPSPRQSSADTESMHGVPGPQSHDPLDEVRNQALHINQLNLRLTEQARQLAHTGEQIFDMRAELQHLRDVVARMNIGADQARAPREPCGMMTVRGHPCTKPKSSCVYRAAGCHPIQRQRRQSMDADRDYDDGMDHE